MTSKPRKINTVINHEGCAIKCKEAYIILILNSKGQANGLVLVHKFGLVERN